MRLNLRSADLGAFLLFFSFEEKSREMRRKCNDNCGCGQMVLVAGALALFVACGISEIADKKTDAAKDEILNIFRILGCFSFLLP